MPFIFKEPLQDEYAAIAIVMNAAQEPFRKLDRVTYGEEETADTITDMARRRNMLCAYDGVTVVGVVAFRQKNMNTVWVSSLFVAPQYQGKGIGGALLQQVESWGKKNGVCVLALETDRKATWACDFYLREGYQILTDEDMRHYPWDMVLDKPQVSGRYVFGKKLKHSYSTSFSTLG